MTSASVVTENEVSRQDRRCYPDASPLVLWCSLECTPACQAGGRGFKSRQDRAMRCLGTSCTDVLGHPSRLGLPLVVAGGIEGELSDELAALVEHTDVQVVHEYQDPAPAV